VPILGPANSIILRTCEIREIRGSVSKRFRQRADTRMGIGSRIGNGVHEVLFAIPEAVIAAHSKRPALDLILLADHSADGW
jgi:hypothetical protein